MKKKEKILITGGAGYLGSMITTYLVYQGYEVTVIDKLIYSKNSLTHLFVYSNFSLVIDDVTKKKIILNHLKNKDIIIPLAALVGAPLCEKNKKLATKLNVKVIENICHNLKKKQKIIFLTTNSGYGVGEKKKYCDETSSLRPVSYYGKTKNQAEEIIRKRGNQISFRLATVFGFSFRMRTDLLVNFMVLQAFKRKKIKIFEPHFRRNFVHILDVVKAIHFSILNFKRLKNNVFNLGLSNANITKLQLLKKIKRKINKFKIIIDETKKDPDQRDYFVSNKKIEKTGFKASISLEKGIDELVDIYSLDNTNFKNNY